jgi:dihydroxy-acid dehydratase
VAVVFDGREDYHARINDPSMQIDENSILIIRGTGPIGYPGGAEVVNMQPPDACCNAASTTTLHRRWPAVRHVGSPSILNASPEAAVGGGLALVRTGDRIRIDLNTRQANI